MTPTFSHKSDDTSEKKRVMSEDTSSAIRCLLRANVLSGSATSANLQDYSVGGAISVSEKIRDGHYVPGKYVVSFIGMAPAQKPEYIYMTLLDEPHSNLQDDGRHSVIQKSAVLAAQIISDTASAIRLPRKNAYEDENTCRTD